MANVLHVVDPPIVCRTCGLAIVWAFRVPSGALFGKCSCETVTRRAPEAPPQEPS